MNKPTLEELVLEHEKAKGVIEETEAAMKVIKDEIMDRLKEMKITGTKTKNGYFVKKITMTTFNGVVMSTARELGAVRQKEALDITMLRKLQEKGIKIAGAKTIQYIKIEEAK